jgi:hypothetical protein
VCGWSAGVARRRLDHVLLGVASIDADCVQLHHSAAVIFVQPTIVLRLLLRRLVIAELLIEALAARGYFLLRLLPSAGINAEPVVEVEEHRGGFWRFQSADHRTGLWHAAG